MPKQSAVLAEHLASPVMKCVTFMSPQTQNELLDAIGKRILSDIVKAVAVVKYYSIMADEKTCHNQEYLALCVRYIDQNGKIHEEFIAFSHVVRITGIYIANEIKTILQNAGFVLENIRGMGFDGAANMSSKSVGVQAIIKQDSPLATYICSDSSINSLYSERIATFHRAVVTSRYV